MSRLWEHGGTANMNTRARNLMLGRRESLNVAEVATILIYEAVRQRRVRA